MTPEQTEAFLEWCEAHVRMDSAAAGEQHRASMENARTWGRFVRLFQFGDETPWDARFHWIVNLWRAKGQIP